MTSRAFAYAQARLQARFGEQPGAGVWDSLQTLVELPALLEQIRLTSLRHWIVNISVSTPAHEMERLLRRRLRALVDEVANWLPAEWRAAVRWTEILPDLPALAHLLQGGEARSWMADETALQELARLEPALRARAVLQSRFAPLLPFTDGETLGMRWLAEWRRRWPDGSKSERAALEQLVARTQAHVGQFAVDRSTSGWAARKHFQAEVTFLFRRRALTAAAAFAWLLLAALEVERVRAAIIERAHFAPGAH